MQLDNQTLLGSCLSHMHAEIRRLMQLEFEQSNRRELAGLPLLPMSDQRKECREQWEDLRRMLWDLLQLSLKPFGELAHPGTYHTHSGESATGPLCTRYNFTRLKKMADKYRRKHPEFMFLVSWDLQARTRTEERRTRRGF